MVTVKKVRRINVSTSLDEEILYSIDEMASVRNWTRPQALRNFLTGLVRSLKKAGHDKSGWYSLNDLEIKVKPSVFDKMK